MTKRRSLGGRVAAYGCLLGSVLLLTGCMPPPQPTVHQQPSGSSAMDAALMRAVSSIQQVTDNLRAAHGVAWQGVYQGFPHRDGAPVAASAKPQPPVSGPLSQRMYVQWSGPVNTLLEALALKMGWQYRDESGMGNHLDVSVYGRHRTVLSILQSVASQLPNSVVLRVTPGSLSLREAPSHE